MQMHKQSNRARDFLFVLFRRMAIYPHLLRRPALLLFAAGALFSNPALAAFVVSAQADCLGKNIYAYRFSRSVANADFSVQVSQSTLLPDITLKLVSDPDQADLILADRLEDNDMEVCKSISAVGIKTILITDTAFRPDVKVTLAESSLLPDYTIFVQSESFTNEEAAALFAVIWKVNKELL